MLASHFLLFTGSRLTWPQVAPCMFVNETAKTLPLIDLQVVPLLKDKVSLFMYV